MRRLVRSKLRRLVRSKKKKKKYRRYSHIGAGDVAAALNVYHATFDELNDEITPAKKPTPEELTIRNDLWFKLSAEAKEVAHTILNSPKDFVEDCMWNKPYTKYRRRANRDPACLIKTFFRKKWGGNRSKVNNVFKELEMYLKKIN